MASTLKGRSFLTLFDCSTAEIEHLLELAEMLKQMKKAGEKH